MDLNLNTMTTEEKLRAMELLWDDLCRNVPDLSSPDWHEQVLKERQKRLESGDEKILDWEVAKKEIWDSVR